MRYKISNHALLICHCAAVSEAFDFVVVVAVRMRVLQMMR